MSWKQSKLGGPSKSWTVSSPNIHCLCSYLVLRRQVVALLHDPSEVVAQSHNSKGQLLNRQEQIKWDLYRILIYCKDWTQLCSITVLYLPSASGILPFKVIQIYHGQPLHHGLSGIQRLQRDNRRQNGTGCIFHGNVKAHRPDAKMSVWFSPICGIYNTTGNKLKHADEILGLKTVQVINMS